MQRRAGEEPDGRSMLSEAGRLFALAGGYCMPGVRLDLSEVEWLFRARDLAGAREESNDEKEQA